MRRLDGLPLALELAAARADVLPPTRLLALAARRLDALAAAVAPGGRRVSLQDAVALSWELLPDEGRLALLGLAALNGPFDAAASAAVLGLEGAIAWRVVLDLARRSLVVTQGPDQARLSDLVRRFARAEAERQGLLVAAAARRDAHLLELAEGRYAVSRRAGGAAALAELGFLREALGATVAEAIAGGPAIAEAGLRAALVLALHARRACLPPWGLGELGVLEARAEAAPLGLRIDALLLLARLETDAGRPEALSRLERARGLADAAHGPEAAAYRARVAVHLGRWAFDRSRFDEAARHDAEALADALAAGPVADEVRAMALTNMTMAAIRLGRASAPGVAGGEPVDALARLAEARALFVSAGALDRVPLHMAIVFFVASQLGELERGREALLDGLAVARDVGAPRDAIVLGSYLGVSDLDRGELAAARAHLEGAYDRGRRGFERLAGQCAVMVAWVELERGDLAATARWCQIAREQLGPFGSTCELAFVGAVDAARAALGGDLVAAWEQRARLDPAMLARDDGVSAAASGLGAVVELAALAAARAAGDEGAATLARDAAAAHRSTSAPRPATATTRGAPRARGAGLGGRRGGRGRGPLRRPGGAALRLGGSGRPWEPMARRPTLARVLAALVRARLDRPGELLDGAALGEAGWPGERMQAESRDNRLYVALSKLRQAGLDDALETLPGGWRLRPTLGVLCVEPAAWPGPSAAPAPPRSAPGRARGRASRRRP
ncbi:MAG: hypothetical protein H6745_33150 [Deltaproteobacteria bacterium]|nr:hypothetical protein [Deltaproteobacteria bacterium]